MDKRAIGKANGSVIFHCSLQTFYRFNGLPLACLADHVDVFRLVQLSRF